MFGILDLVLSLCQEISLIVKEINLNDQKITKFKINSENIEIEKKLCKLKKQKDLLICDLRDFSNKNCDFIIKKQKVM